MTDGADSAQVATLLTQWIEATRVLISAMAAQDQHAAEEAAASRERILGQMERLGPETIPHHLKKDAELVEAEVQALAARLMSEGRESLQAAASTSRAIRAYSALPRHESDDRQ